MSLEDRVTEGRASYVSRVEYDDSGRCLTLHLLADPEHARVVRVIRFPGVEDYHRVWHEPEDPDLLESLIGISEARRGPRTQVWICLEQSEISFATEREPIIEE